jgi:hypothetical protein
LRQVVQTRWCDEKAIAHENSGVLSTLDSGQSEDVFRPVAVHFVARLSEFPTTEAVTPRGFDRPNNNPLSKFDSTDLHGEKGAVLHVAGLRTVGRALFHKWD